jgi:hypothetical protein
MHLLFITEDVLLLISGLGLLQAALLAILIYYHPRSDKAVNKFLALYIFSFTLIMAGPFIIRNHFVEKSIFLRHYSFAGGTIDVVLYKKF